MRATLGNVDIGVTNRNAVAPSGVLTARLFRSPTRFGLPGMSLSNPPLRLVRPALSAGKRYSKRRRCFRGMGRHLDAVLGALENRIGFSINHIGLQFSEVIRK